MADIIKWPDPRLEQKALEVPHGERCRELIEEMFASLGPTGIGLAAPQLGVMKRVIVIRVPLRGLGQTNKGNFVKLAFINPVMTWAKPGMVEAMEGCLSFPHHEVSVPRFMRITVQGYDVKWNPLTHTAKDLVARALQHEIDHLEGRCLATYARMAHEANEAALAKINEEVDGATHQRFEMQAGYAGGGDQAVKVLVTDDVKTAPMATLASERTGIISSLINALK